MTAPDTDLTAVPDAPVSGWNSGPVDVSLSASGSEATSAIAGSYCIVDGMPQSYAGTFTLSAEGVHQIDYWSADASGDLEPPSTAAVKIDETAPTTSDDHEPIYDDTATIHLSAADSLSGVATTTWTLDGVSGVGNIVSTSALGTHELKYCSADEAGNVSATTTVEFLLIHDLTPPVTSVSPIPQGWVNHDVEVSLVASDADSPVGITTYLGLNDGPLSPYADSLTISSEGTTTIAYFSADASGNTEATKTAEVRIDKSAPITTDDHVATYTAAADVSLEASDALSGVGSTNWTLDGTPGSGTRIATSELGSHTLAYSSIDNAGNSEVTTTVHFVVVPIPPSIRATKIGLAGAASGKLNKTYKLSGQLMPSAAGGRVQLNLTVLVGKKSKSYGRVSIAILKGKFSYSFKPSRKGTWHITAVYGGQTTATLAYEASSAGKSFKIS